MMSTGKKEKAKKGDKKEKMEQDTEVVSQEPIEELKKGLLRAGFHPDLAPFLAETFNTAFVTLKNLHDGLEESFLEDLFKGQTFKGKPLPPFVLTNLLKMKHDSQSSPPGLLSVTNLNYKDLPDNGLSCRFQLSRSDVVQEVYEQAVNRRCVIVGSSPGTGKTSVLQLLEEKLRAQSINAHYFRIHENITTIPDFLSRLKKDTQIDFDQTSQLDLKETWILFDDAQNAYEENLIDVWPLLLKAVSGNFKVQCSVRFVIATTYDVTKKSPVNFASYPHVSPLPSLTEFEATDFYNFWSKGTRWEDWREFRATLYTISGGHVGVMLAGLLMLFHLDHLRAKVPKNRQDEFTENIAKGYLRTKEFFDQLGRCFPQKKYLPKGGEEMVLEMIFRGETKPKKQHGIIVTTPSETQRDSSNDNEVENELRRGGIISDGGFCSIAASWYFYNRLFPFRAIHEPRSIGELVIRSLLCMSARSLKDASQGSVTNFPKEHAFQHLFNEALVRNLPAHHVIIPEKTAERRLPIVAESEGGSVDFYINGDKNWAIELLRLGTHTTIKEHISRFEAVLGKYRTLDPKQYLVVDWTDRTRDAPIVTDSHLCTLQFSSSFQECVCFLGLRPPILLRLELDGLSCPPSSVRLEELFKELEAAQSTLSLSSSDWENVRKTVEKYTTKKVSEAYDIDAWKPPIPVDILQDTDKMETS